MGSKQWIVILAFGLVGLCSMGLLTKFAVDSNPQLKKLVQIKAALASDLRPRGVEEVSLRRMPGSGFQIRLVCEPEAGGDDLDLLAAKNFAKGYPEAVGDQLEVLRVEPAGFGCSGESIAKQSQFNLQALRLSTAEEARQERVAGDLSQKLGLRLLGRKKEDRTLRVEVQAPPGAALEEMEALARKAEPIVRAAEFPPTYTVLTLVVHPQPEAAAPPGSTVEVRVPVVIEVRFDLRGRETRARRLARRGTRRPPRRQALERSGKTSPSSPSLSSSSSSRRGCARCLPVRWRWRVRQCGRRRSTSTARPGTSGCSSRASASRGRGASWTTGPHTVPSARSMT